MKKSDETKKKIIESTVYLVARDGYTGTSTKQIATHAGVSEAIIFKYYGNKNQLLMTIVQQTIDEFYDYSFNHILPDLLDNNDKKNFSDLVYNIMFERFSYFNKNSKKLQVIFQEMLVNEQIREYFKKKVWSRLDALSREILERGQKEGVLREIDPYFMQKAFFGMLLYTNVFERIFGVDTNAYSPETQAKISMDVLFNGIKN